MHDYFFSRQRVKLIDAQLKETTELLLNSKEFRVAVSNPKTLEHEISKILRGRRIGKVFAIRSKEGAVLFESENLNLIQIKPPISPRKVSVETDEQFIRVINAEVPENSGSILQVAVVLDRNFITWQILNYKVANYIIAIVTVLFAVSVLLTLLLLSPLRMLISHLSRATADLSNLKEVEPLPRSFLKFTDGLWSRSDEFGKLIEAVGKLIRRINLNHKLTRSWTYQMAHELKTPLAVISAVTESRSKLGEIAPAAAKAISTEVKQMSGTINEFLDWAELESSHLSKELHSIKVSKMLRHIATRIENIEPNRLLIKTEDEISVFAKPVHLDQLMTNLITNALKFSAGQGPVVVELVGRELRVKDLGAGVPSEVLERLGEPFNVGSNEHGDLVGSGLGLAWAVTIARLYGWKFDLETSSQGTIAKLDFGAAE